MGFMRIDLPPEEPLWKRILQSIQNRNQLEWYATNSLTEMNQHFAEHPPATIEKHWFEKPSAYVLIHGSSIRRKPGIPENLVDKKYEVKFPSRPPLFPGDNPPLKTILTISEYVPFEVKTGTIIQEADWVNGRNEIYERAQSKYHFNDRDFVPVDWSVVQYFHDPNLRLILRDFDFKFRKQKQPVKNKVPDITIEKGIFVPQLAY